MPRILQVIPQGHVTAYLWATRQIDWHKKGAVKGSLPYTGIRYLLKRETRHIYVAHPRIVIKNVLLQQTCTVPQTLTSPSAPAVINLPPFSADSAEFQETDTYKGASETVIVQQMKVALQCNAVKTMVIGCVCWPAMSCETVGGYIHCRHCQ